MKHEAGEVVKPKVRLVVRGIVQQEGIDYDNTFAPWPALSPSASSLRLLPRRDGASTTWT
jgi:hypothetical protein